MSNTEVRGENVISNPFSEYSGDFARRCDAAYDNRDAKQLTDLIAEGIEALDKQDDASKLSLCYSIGTSYGNLEQIGNKADSVMCREKQLCYLHASIDLISDIWDGDKTELPFILGLILPLYTNYANALDQCGRKIRAMDFYLRALKHDVSFAMAIGNAGMAYFHYAMLVPFPAHRHIINHFAYCYLKQAIENPDAATPQYAIDSFQKTLMSYNRKYVDAISLPLKFRKYRYRGKELDYRRWVLKNRLYVNPLNELPVHELSFAADVMHLPDMIVPLDAKPVLPGLFNQLKQEYIYARYLFYESIQRSEKTHYADKDTYLLQFPDYPVYSIRCEKMKTAFRSLYSLLDKLAFFINEYFVLEIAEKAINYRTIWKKPKLMNEVKDNLALNALWWIKKEIYTDEGVYTSPSAPRKNDVRNALEHKYLKVHMCLFASRITGEIDDKAFYIAEDELEEMTLEMLKLLREALIMLVLAVHIEERKRNADRDSSGIVLPMPFLDYDDDWKI